MEVIPWRYGEVCGDRGRGGGGVGDGGGGMRGASSWDWNAGNLWRSAGGTSRWVGIFVCRCNVGGFAGGGLSWVTVGWRFARRDSRRAQPLASGSHIEVTGTSGNCAPCSLTTPPKALCFYLPHFRGCRGARLHLALPFSSSLQNGVMAVSKATCLLKYTCHWRSKTINSLQMLQMYLRARAYWQPVCQCRTTCICICSTCTKKTIAKSKIYTKVIKIINTI